MSSPPVSTITDTLQLVSYGSVTSAGLSLLSHSSFYSSGTALFFLKTCVRYKYWDHTDKYKAWGRSTVGVDVSPAFPGWAPINTAHKGHPAGRPLLHVPDPKCRQWIPMSSDPDRHCRFVTPGPPILSKIILMLLMNQYFSASYKKKMSREIFVFRVSYALAIIAVGRWWEMVFLGQRYIHLTRSFLPSPGPWDRD